MVQKHVLELFFVVISPAFESAKVLLEDSNKTLKHQNIKSKPRELIGVGAIPP
jgi:hypothetical protein